MHPLNSGFVFFCSIIQFAVFCVRK
jgi:hypothetical protein